MISTIFFDIGGVLLTDGWGHDSRRLAAEKFGLDWEEYRDRHEKVAHVIETNRMSLDEYLTRAVFYRVRTFTREEFRSFIFAQSQPHPEAISLVKELALSKKYFLATLNNEILELNQYRIETFHLTEYFPIFFSSCFLGLRKPDKMIYQLALAVTHTQPADCVFIDDREVNLECPTELGVNTILFRDANQLRADLRDKGIDI